MVSASFTSLILTPSSLKRSAFSIMNFSLSFRLSPNRDQATDNSSIAAIGLAAQSTTALLNSSVAFWASLDLLIYLETNTIIAVIAADKPNVKVANNACAATVETPRAVANPLVAVASNVLALATVTRIKGESLFNICSTC